MGYFDSKLKKMKMHNKAWVDNRPLAFQFRHNRVPMSAVPPL